MLPVAPVMFSTERGCPRFAYIASVTVRMHKSDGPPIAVGTTIRMGFSGNAAVAAVQVTSEMQAAAAAVIFDIQEFIRPSSFRAGPSARAAKRMLAEQFYNALRRNRRLGNGHFKRREGILDCADDRGDRGNRAALTCTLDSRDRRDHQRSRE